VRRRLRKERAVSFTDFWLADPEDDNYDNPNNWSLGPDDDDAATPMIALSAEQQRDERSGRP
jgi:hypothetical protein